MDAYGCIWMHMDAYGYSILLPYIINNIWLFIAMENPPIFLIGKTIYFD